MSEKYAASKLIVNPSAEIIDQVKKDYNRVLKRFTEAGKFWSKPAIPSIEKEKYLVQFSVEVLGVLDGYLNVLKDWNVLVSDNEIINGFKL